MQAHEGACAVQIVAAGRAISVSSSVPALTKTRCGRASASLNRWVPQLGQKRRCIRFPLSAMLTKSRVSPVIANPADGKHTLTAALPVAIYWQTRHQHSRAVIGAAFVSYRTAPQRQLPEIVIHFSSLTPVAAPVNDNSATSSLSVVPPPANDNPPPTTASSSTATSSNP